MLGSCKGLGPPAVRHSSKKGEATGGGGRFSGRSQPSRYKSTTYVSQMDGTRSYRKRTKIQPGVNASIQTTTMRSSTSPNPAGTGDRSLTAAKRVSVTLETRITLKKTTTAG